MADERLRNKSELKRLFTNLRGKNITEEMMSIAIDSLWRDKLVQRTSGFEFPAHFDSEISFDTITRIFTIKPWNPLVEGFMPRYGIYSYLDHPIFHRHFEPFEIQIPKEEGLFCVYFDNEPAPGNSLVLFYKKNPTAQELENIYISKILVSFIYWDSNNQELIHFGDDRHGSEWNPQIQQYLHSAFGAIRKNGLQFNNYILNGDGSSNNHAKLSVTGGTILHDDIEISINSAGPGMQIQYAISGLPRFLSNNGFAIYANSSRVYYNAGLQTIAQAASENFVLYHIFATNERLIEARKIISVMGTAQYTSIADAYAAVNPDIEAVASYMPQQGRCYLGTIIIQTSDDYENDVKARIVSLTGNVSHLPVTISPESKQYLGISEKQELTIYVENLPGGEGGGGGESLFPDTITSETTNSETETTHTHKLGTILQDAVKFENKDFGFYYTFNVCIDPKGLSSNPNWIIPTAAQWIALRTFAGSYEVAGGIFKQTGNKNWLEPNLASDYYGFAAVGNGFCTTSETGSFSLQGQVGSLWALDSNQHNTEASVQYNPWSIAFMNSSTGMWYSFLESLHEGIGIRLCNPSTLLSEGENGVYIGNNGIQYKTVVINSIEWLCENLREDLWNDLTEIPKVNDGPDWMALTDFDSAHTRRVLELDERIDEKIRDIGKVKVSVDDTRADYLENKITADGNLSFTKEADENGIETLRLNIAIDELDFHIQFIDDEDYTFIVPFACLLTNISYSGGLSLDMGSVQTGDIFSQYDEIPIIPGGTGLLTLTFNNNIQQGGGGD